MKLTDAEWKVMDTLWEDAPLTAREILEHMEPDNQWAYTTVKTVLTRLHTKNAVDVDVRGNANFYRPTVSREDARHTEVHSMLRRAFDGALGPLMHFLVTEEKLSDEEREKLLRLLQEKREDS